MRFAPDKYTLTHFTRRRNFDLSQPIRLAGVEINPTPSMKMLGLQLDSELRWKMQAQAIHTKMKTQVFALARTTASTWGITLGMARQVYLAIVRSALSYGASLWHTPGESPTDRPRGPAGGLRAHQNSCLRTVLGAIRATPIRQLETEAYIPPFDLWFWAYCDLPS
jgi:hypothetical protein